MRIAALVTAGLLASSVSISSNAVKADDYDQYDSHSYGLVIVEKDYYGKETGKFCKYVDKSYAYEYKYILPYIDIKIPGKSKQEFVKCSTYDKNDYSLYAYKDDYGFPCKKVVKSKNKYGKEIVTSYLTYKSSWKQGDYKGEMNCHFNDKKDEYPKD